MLNFVLGRSGTGKTTYIKNTLSNLANSGNNKLMMIVPDQSSFETEKSFLDLLGEKLCRNVKVFGFSRLCDYIFAETGNFRSNPIDEGTRKIIMSMAIEQVSDVLELFSKQKGSVLDLMVHSYKECSKCNISPDMLYSTAELIEQETLSKKLKETSYVLKAYDAIIANTYIDPCENLTKAVEILTEHNLFDGYTIAIDSFSGFTAQQYSMLECLLKQSKDFYASLTVDTDETVPSPAFKTTFETKTRIFNLAQKLGIETAPYILLEDNHRIKSNDLLHLEQSIYNNNSTQYTDIPENLSLIKAIDMNDEAVYVSNKVKELVIDKGYRYKDIAVIAHDSTQYAKHISSAFIKNNIPCFMDYPEDIYIKPVIRLVCSCFDAVIGNFEREDVLSILKTQLTNNSIEEISIFENYLFKWNINYAKLKSEFTLNPSGFSDKLTDEDKEQLAICEKVRKSVIEPLVSFKEKTKDVNGSEISKALYDLLLKLNVPECLDKLYDELEKEGDFSLAQQQVKLWNVVIKSIDKMNAVLDNRTISLKRYYELLSLQFENEQISDIPQSFDSVRFGDAQRIRLDDAKVVFILGVNENVFPPIPKIAGVFTEIERRILSNAELPFQDSMEDISNHEKFLAYSSLSSASEKLFVLCHTSDNKGEAVNPSDIYLELLKIYPNIKIIETETIPLADKIWSNATAFEYCAKNYNDLSATVANLKEYFSDKENYNSKLETISNELKNKPITIKNLQNAEKLFGKDMFLSASQIDKYSQCAFSYFCNYGLRIKERRPAKIDALEFGTITHYFFEKFLSMYSSAELKELSVDVIKEDIDKIYLAYANENLGGLENKSQEFINLFERMKENSFELIQHLIKELSQSDFKPVDYELNIGNDIPYYTLNLSTGQTITIRGSVDRVDVMEKNGNKYIRVVDYKTGPKEFSLCDIIYGLNLQMLIYLHAIEKNGTKRYGDNIIPAGVLYMPSKPSTITVEVGATEDKIDKKIEESFKMNGIVLNDITVVEGMDKTGKGTFIPASVKSGLPYSTKSLATLEEIGFLFNKIDQIITKMAENLYNGDVSAVPIKGKYQNGCQYCQYSSVCNYKEKESKYRFADNLKAKDVLANLKEEFNKEVD